MQTISFMTANYVARQVGYQMTEGWGQGDKATNAHFRPAATFAERFEEYVRDVATLGFEALDLWTSILNPAWATDAHIDAASEILAQYNLKVASLAGWFGATPEEFEASCELASALSISVLGGNTSVAQKDRAFLVDMLRKYGLRWGFENHPDERSAEDVLQKIGDADTDVVGVCVDTGWFGTNGVDAPSALETLAPRLFHVHLKDVLSAGAHDTCRFGAGVVNIRGCVETLQRIGYTGGISIEHEPELFDPTDDVKASFELLKGWLSS